MNLEIRRRADEDLNRTKTNAEKINEQKEAAKKEAEELKRSIELQKAKLAGKMAPVAETRASREESVAANSGRLSNAVVSKFDLRLDL